MENRSNKWRAISGVLIVSLITTALLVLGWGTVSAEDEEGTGLTDWWWVFLAGVPDAGYSTVDVSPDTLRADGSSTAVVTAQAQDGVNAVVPGAFVCFTTTLGTIDSQYGAVEAESTSVVTSPVSPPGWSYLSSISGASGGQYIEANAVTVPTAEASWTFTGDAVALRYYKAADAGIFEIRFDAGTWQEVDPYAATGSWAEQAWSGFGAGSHSLEVRVTNRNHWTPDPVGGFFTRLDLFRFGALSAADGSVTGTLTAANFKVPSPQYGTVMATIIKDGTSIAATTSITMVASVPTTVTVEVDSPKSMQVGGNTLGATATLIDSFGLPVVDGTMVGFTTTVRNRATVPYDYAEAEDTSKVIRDGTWSTDTDANYSGGSALTQGSGQGPSLVWSFQGTAVSLIYRRDGTSGTGNVGVDVDGTDSRIIDLSVGDPVNAYRNEILLFGSLSSGSHTLTVTKNSASGDVYLDAFRSGTTTSGGQASATLTSEAQTGDVDVYADAPYGDTDRGVRGYAEGSDTLTILAGAPYTATFLSTPYSTTCGGAVSYPFYYPLAMPVHVQVRDLYNNYVPTATVTFESSLSGVWYNNPETTDSNGLATAGFLVSGPGATGIVTASVGSVVTSTTFTVTPSSPYTATISASPAEIYASGTSTTTITVSVEDECGNAVSDGTVVTIATDLGGFPAPYIPPMIKVVTTTGGDASTVLTSDSSVGTATITGTVDGVNVTTTVGFVPGPAYTMVISPSAVTVSCAATTEISASVRDEWGNNLADLTSVTFTDDLGGSFSPNPSTMAAGWATTVHTAHSVGTGVITATHGSISGTIPLTTTVGPAAQVSLTRSPIVINAGPSGTAVITATVSDACDNKVVAGVPVTFTTTQGSLSPASGNTDASGQLASTLTATWPPAKVTITATAGSGTGTTFVYFAGAAKNVTLSADPVSISVGGSATSTITADVRDDFGVPVVDGTQMVFETSLGTIGSTIVTRTTTYDAVEDKALATAVLTSGIQAGTAYVTATVPFAFGSGSTTVEFLPGGLATFEFNHINSPQTAGTAFSITIWAKDAYGNVATGYMGPVVLSDFLGSISPIVTGLFSGGSWTGDVTLTKAGTTWITAQDGLIQQSSGVFTVNPGPPDSLSLNAVPDMILPDGTSASTLTAMVKDQWSNDVADGTTVNFSSTLGDLSAPSATTASGVAQVTLTGTTVGIATVSASSGSASDTDTVEFTWTIPTATPTSTGTPGPTSTPTATSTPGPSPTPTETPTGQASVQGHVDLQARPAPPNSQWVTVLDIEVRQGGVFTYTFTGVSTDQSGDFTIGGMTPGVYDIWLKNFHALSNLKQNVTLNAGSNSVDMGELQEGDASDDNLVDIDDFGILKTQFGTAGPEADFNQDGVVDIDDFGLLKVNFGESGDVIVTAMPSGKSMKLKAMAILPGGDQGESILEALEDASVRVSPSTETVNVGEEFTVEIVVDPGLYGADSAQAYLSIDPNYLEIVEIVDGDVPPNMSRAYDSATGQLDYAWASFDPALRDSFTLCTVRLRAKAATSGPTYIIFDCTATKLNNGGKPVLTRCYDAEVTVASAAAMSGSGATIAPVRAEEEQSR